MTHVVASTASVVLLCLQDKGWLVVHHSTSDAQRAVLAVCEQPNHMCGVVLNIDKARWFEHPTSTLK